MVAVVAFCREPSFANTYRRRFVVVVVALIKSGVCREPSLADTLRHHFVIVGLRSAAFIDFGLCRSSRSGLLPLRPLQLLPLDLLDPQMHPLRTQYPVRQSYDARGSLMEGSILDGSVGESGSRTEAMMGREKRRASQLD